MTVCVTHAQWSGVECAAASRLPRQVSLSSSAQTKVKISKKNDPSSVGMETKGGEALKCGAFDIYDARFKTLITCEYEYPVWVPSCGYLLLVASWDTLLG